MARHNLSKTLAKIASSVRSFAPGAHLNWMGGTSYDVRSPLVRLRVVAASCFFGEPTYYQTDRADPRPRRVQGLTGEQRRHLRATLHAIDPDDWRGLTPTAVVERCIDDALAHDPEGTLRLAAWLRAEGHVRTTPQVILVRAAHHPLVRGTGLVRRYAPSIVRRADEPASGLAYQLARYGRPIPNALKRAWADALAGFNAYELAKYRLAARQVKTVDVVNLVHAKSAPVDALAKNQLTTTDETWEAIVSARGSNAAAWREALPKMGHMALLRNLRNLVAAKVPPAEWTPRLVDGARTGQQLPFRYYSAYRAVKALPETPGAVLDAVERCLRTSMGNLPRFEGRVMSLCDNSGSARGAATSSMGSMSMATIANLTGVLAAQCADDGRVGVFGDSLREYTVRAGASTIQQLEEVERLGDTVGQATENGIWLFWDRAIQHREHWDHVFVFSDMQAGHGGLYGTNPKSYAAYAWSDSHFIDVPRLVATYRERVNPRVNVYLVQVAGYRDTLMPELYERTFILGGWGEGLLRFAAEMADVAVGKGFD